MSEFVKFADGIRRKQEKMAPNQITQQPFVGQQGARDLDEVAPRSRGVIDEQFPVDSFGAYSDKDKEMVARLQLSEGHPMGYTPFGKMEMRKGDIEWYQAKMAAAEAANFDKWYAINFDFMSPAEKKRAKELNPKFYARRKALLKRQAKNLVKLAQIKIDGVQSMSDLTTQYLAESGRLDLGPIQNLLRPELIDSKENDDANSGRFVRGLANPFRVFGMEAYPESIAMRSLQSQNFAERNVPQDTLDAGAQTPYPNFHSNATDQGDAAWYKKLNSYAGTVNATGGT